jgi:hypothetical protein
MVNPHVAHLAGTALMLIRLEAQLPHRALDSLTEKILPASAGA